MEYRCDQCSQGTYKELSIFDDWDGMMTCDFCSHRTSTSSLYIREEIDRQIIADIVAMAKADHIQEQPQMVVRHIRANPEHNIAADWTVEYGDIVCNLNDDESVKHLIDEISDMVVAEIEKPKLP